jgi:energy-converting hydrogenase A subunit H
MWELFTAAVTVPVIAKGLLVIGVIGEGMAPVYVAKAEITRAPGAPYVLMIHVSSLLMFLRVIEIIISM